MRVNFPGFNGGDRTSILLPAVQTNLLKALQATGKPVVFVMMTGSALAIPWEAQHIPAIVNAWYGGQSAGTALADVLFGDYNPSGRLPVTFYQSDADLPDFNDYSMKGRTYRYFTGQPLYGFGYGLSYTSFSYSKPQVVTGRNTVTVTAIVTNTGKRGGEEVAQLYVSGKEAGAPVRSLKGFQRIFLKAGESRKLVFNLKPDDLSTLDETGHVQRLTQSVLITVGGCQPDAGTAQRQQTVQVALRR